MNATEFIVTGWAEGNWEAEIRDRYTGKVTGSEMRPYANLYVVHPVSDYESEDYSGTGYKAEKLRCASPEVWKDLVVGEVVQLFYGEKKVVQMIKSTGKVLDIENFRPL